LTLPTYLPVVREGPRARRYPNALSQ
jgi:hypothetical protein